MVRPLTFGVAGYRADMKSLVAASLFSALAIWRGEAQSNFAPARLAIVVENPSAAAAADLLTAELSKRVGLQLMEREQILKVYREQELSAVNTDYLKLGQVLGAEGLMLLDGGMQDTNQWIGVQLVAVRPGVLLSSERFELGRAPAGEWAAAISKHLGILLPKLTVLAKDAHPISVVSLRSAVQSAESRELERQLTLLAIERLSREKDLFVLERRRMQLMTAEKALTGLNDSAFWDGSYLLDGVIDREGYDGNTMRISARLRPPNGSVPTSIEVTCSRTNQAEAINQLTGQVLKALKLNGNGQKWDAAAEAEQYFSEAQWAFKWRLYPQAQAASEAAWALGKQTTDSAVLRICAYFEGVPDKFFQRQISAQALPDASEIRRCTRALELFAENQQMVFETNARSANSGYLLGLQLIRKTAELLESYYYAAELRAGHENDLAELRLKTRDALQAMDAHPPAFDWSRPWYYIRLDYDWLKWEEGGLAAERPEDALPMLREVLESGYQPEELPRVIAWSWDDRKRVPRLMRQFISDLKGSPNPLLKMQGAYMALLWTPMDGTDAIRLREDELLASIWENRQGIFTNSEIARVLECVESSLREKYKFEAWDKFFDHEPFATFKHRLRISFVEQAKEGDRLVFQSLFPSNSRENESSTQADELLPLVLNFQQRLRTNYWLTPTITKFQQRAGLPSKKPAPLKPKWPAADVTEVKFIPWHLHRPGIESGRKPDFRQLIAQDGKLWVQARYASDPGKVWRNDVQVNFVCIDPLTGTADEIRFPENFGSPLDNFAVANDSIFVTAGNHLYRGNLRDKTWKLEVSAEIAGRPFFTKGRLFLAREDGLMEVESNSVRLLVSARRQPPENDIDPLWNSQVRVHARADGTLACLSENACFDLDPAAGSWNIRPSPFGTNSNYFSFRFPMLSSGASLWLWSGPVQRLYVVGYWSGNSPAESLLMATRMSGGNLPRAEQRLQPARWDWPEGFSLEGAQIFAENKSLWVLCPRKEWQPYGPVYNEPVIFSDNRQATILHFGPESRRPSSLAVHLENNGRTAEPFNPNEGGFRTIFDLRPGGSFFWIKTAEGLVIGASGYPGHWLIPASVLKTKLAAEPDENSTPLNLEAPAHER